MKRPKIPKIRKKQIRRLTRRILPQLLIQSIGVTATAMASFFLMTWLVSDLMEVKHIYAAAGFEMLGTLGILILVLVPLNTFFYRRRATEVVTLSDAIQAVAGGDYTSKISTEKRMSITPIYEDFNKMCDELQSVQILRNDFINNYSHEFKTPIVSIAGFAKLLQRGNLTEAQQQEYLAIIESESRRLSYMATNVLSLTKVENQTILSDVTEYNLSEQLRSCILMLERKWESKRLDLQLEFEEHSICANEELLKQVWINPTRPRATAWAWRWSSGSWISTAARYAFPAQRK